MYYMLGSMENMHFWDLIGQKKDDEVTHISDTMQNGNNFTMEA